MRAVVLESFVGSDYEDSPTSYEFPSRYLRQLDPLTQGESIIAVIYEPRGDGAGRMAYVGWATLQIPPSPSGRTNARGEPLYVVAYTSRYRDFDRAVPRNLNGEPVETWLRQLPVGRSRNVATFGRAVRSLQPEDLETIFRFGFASDLDTEPIYPNAGEVSQPALQVQERATRIVAVAQREATFRDNVLESYQRRCAITGFSAGTQSPSRMYGLLDIAHIKPVWAQGPDAVANGLALTPTLHRLFDRGLFTLDYSDGRPVIITSPRLDQAMIQSPDETSRLLIATGRQLLLPDNRVEWPHPDALAYHRREVFLSE